MHARLALRPGSEFGFEDAWRAVKLLNRPKKPGKGKGTDSKDNVAGTDAGAELADEALPKSEEEKLKQEEQDMKQLGLTVLSDMADLHERVRKLVSTFFCNLPPHSYSRLAASSFGDNHLYQSRTAWLVFRETLGC